MSERANGQNQQYAGQPSQQTTAQSPYQAASQQPYQQPYQTQNQPYQAAPQQPYQNPAQQSYQAYGTPNAQTQQPYQAPYVNPYQAQTQPVQYQPNPAYGYQTTYPMTETDRTLRLIAFILNVISLVSSAILIIPLAWMIPMCVISWGIYKGTKRNTVGFGVCTLIFLNLIAGILLLCSNKDE